MAACTLRQRRLLGDLNGNRTMTGYQTGGDNQITANGLWTYSYDTEENQTKKTKGSNAETWTYGYDNENHLLWVEQRSTDGGTLLQRLDFKYDVEGQRLEKDVTINSTTTVTRFAYDEGNIWADLNGSNALETRRFYLDAIDSVFARQSSSGTTAWYLPDRLGSIRNIVDSGGALIDTIAYDGFGKVTSESSTANGDRYKFTGRELDAETGFQYHDARYYDPTTARWTSEDPLGLLPDSNPYRYVGNNSQNLTDPSGLAPNEGASASGPLGSFSANVDGPPDGVPGRGDVQFGQPSKEVEQVLENGRRAFAKMNDLRKLFPKGLAADDSALYDLEPHELKAINRWWSKLSAKERERINKRLQGAKPGEQQRILLEELEKQLDADISRWLAMGTGASEGAAAKAAEAWKWKWHWHHMLPKEVFTKGFLKKHGLDGLIDINSAEYGYMFQGKDHIGENGIHSARWNDEWKAWINEHERAGRKITKEMIDKKLKEMKRSKLFRRFFSNPSMGRKAMKTFEAWRAYLRKRSAFQAAKKLAAKLGKYKKTGKRVVKGAIIVAGVVFWVSDVEAKGPIWGTVNTIFDSTPYLGWFKLGTELALDHDWLPDQDEAALDEEEATHVGATSEFFGVPPSGWPPGYGPKPRHVGLPLVLPKGMTEDQWRDREIEQQRIRAWEKYFRDRYGMDSTDG